MTTATSRWERESSGFPAELLLPVAILYENLLADAIGLIAAKWDPIG
jgi:hypothetical protein